MNSFKASKPIPIKTSNLSRLDPCPYPSPVSPTSLVFSPSKFISTYILPPVFTSQYKLGHELGYGGFGFVYSCFRLSDNAQVACKFIFKSKVSRSSWTTDRELGLCPMEVAVLKNVLVALTADFPWEHHRLRGLFRRRRVLLLSDNYAWRPVVGGV